MGFISTFFSFFRTSWGSSTGLTVAAVAVVAVSLEPSFTPPEPELLTDVPSEYYRPSNTFSDSVITSSYGMRHDIEKPFKVIMIPYTYSITDFTLD
ncbi:hypothetical protein Pmani_013597 [Petrolisthes manimaculis]|uniref:Uncharacterized protein n=1 Tax=Petrolisthes manimaculis TaxID=1843537 RepID=A0AAE1PX73_9EUCA|nr:hypothetical protein Pmani_013597 [Petrolisthes manimaculis]